MHDRLDKYRVFLLCVVMLLTTSASLSIPLIDTNVEINTVANLHPLPMADYGKLPIRFEPNVGQAASSIKYLANDAGYNVALTERGIIIAARNTNTNKPTQTLTATSSSSLSQSSLIQIQLINSAMHPVIKAEQPQTSVSNYFIGSDGDKWYRNVANYAAVRYKNVYPGVDWLVYGNPQQLEYDLVVAPYAKTNNIQLKITGASKLSLNDSGELLIKINNQTLKQLKPVIFQLNGNGEKQFIEGQYVLHHQQVSISIAKYDHNRELVIDPAFVYSTYLGGSNGDCINGIAVDQGGNAYVVGNTSSIDFLANTNSQNPVAALQARPSKQNVFIVKLNPTGNTVLSSILLGGTDDDSGTAIAIDSASNIYIAGNTISTDFPIINPPPYPSPPVKIAALRSPPQVKGFIAKVNAAGTTIEYSIYLSGNNPLGGDTFIHSITADDANNVYITGQTYATDFPIVNALQNTNHSQQNIQTSFSGGTAFVTKLNVTDNKLLYSTYLGGSGGDSGRSIAIDGFGNAYIAGVTNSTDFPTTDSFQKRIGNRDQSNVISIEPLSNPTSDAFIVKLSASGDQLIYSTYLGGSNDDSANAIALGLDGSAYVAGSTFSTDFPIANAIQSQNGGFGVINSSNAFITKLNPSGSALIYSTYFGSGTTIPMGIDSSGSVANAIAVDRSGNAYVAGNTNFIRVPTVNPIQDTNDGRKSFVSVINTSGTEILFSTYLGGNHTTSTNAIAVDAMGDIYVAGGTSSTDFPLFNAIQQINKNNGSSQTAFVTKISITLPPIASGNKGGGGSMNWILLLGLGMLSLLQTARVLQPARMR